MRSHEVDYKIFGDDLQFVEIELDPGESVIAEAGTMMYLEDDITFETKMGDGSDPDQGAWGKLKSAGKRAIARESLFPPSTVSVCYSRVWLSDASVLKSTSEP